MTANVRAAKASEAATKNPVAQNPGAEDLTPGALPMPAVSVTKPAATGRGGRRAAALGISLSLALVLLLLVSAAAGQFPIAVPDIIESLERRIAGTPATDPAAVLVDGTLWSVRFPRLLLGLLVGAALGMAGAVMQGVFGNPLAEPGVIGVGSGAAVGACLVIVLGFDALTPFALPAAAFIGGLVTTAAVYLLSRSGNRSMVLTLVLTGIAVNAVAGAVISFLVFVADTSSREQIVFWQIDRKSVV